MKSISINDIPKKYKYLSVILFALLFLLIPREPDSDFYFLYKTGEYVAANGFPVKDFLSWHANMDIIVQQWLFDVFLYYVYTLLGKLGVILYQYVIFVLITLAFFILIKKVSKNGFVAFLATFVLSSFLAAEFITCRPQCFTYLLLILELLVLEKYVESKKASYLLLLPLISALLINLHASMWLMVLLFMLPYLIQSVPIKLGKIRQTPCCSFLWLFAAFAASLCAGFVNPYGIKAMLYLFSSYGVQEINIGITEMNPVGWNSVGGKLLICFVFASAFLLIFNRKGKNELRFILLSVGTAYIGLSSLKGYPYFLIAVLLALAYSYKDFTFNVRLSEKKADKKTLAIRIVSSCVLVALICALGALQFGVIKLSDDNEYPIEESLEPVVAELKEICNEETILYNGFNEGAFLEYNGIPAFIDARAELFLKSNNHEEDYFTDYYNIAFAKVYYKDFVDKYDFNCLLVSKYTEKYLYNSLINDSDFTVVYSEGEYAIFTR